MPILPKARDEKLAQNLAKGSMLMHEAHTDAGFKSKQPADISRKCNQDHIQARVQELRGMRAKVIQRVMTQEIESSHGIALRLGITKEKIIQSLWFNANRCLRGQPVLDENGVQTGKYSGKPDANGFNQAIKLIGLECHGMFVEKLEIGSPGDFSRMNDEEFEKAFQEEALAAGLPQDAVAGLLTYSPEEPPKDDGTENKD